MKTRIFSMTSPSSKMMRYSLSQLHSHDNGRFGLYSPFPCRGVANAKWTSALGSWYHGWGPSPAVLEKKPFFVWGNGFLMYCCCGLGVKGTHFGKLSAIWDPAVFPVQIIGNPKKRNLFSKVLLTSIFPLENDSFLIFQWFCEYQSMVILLSK